MGKQGSLIKRLTDVIFSIFVLFITSPILIISALAIKLESQGPALFIQERTGYLGEKFKMFKFRGMINNALSFGPELTQDRKSTRLNSSHLGISYAVFCLKK